MLAVFCEMGLGIVLLSKMYPEFRAEKMLIKVLAVLLFGVSGFLFAWNSWLFYVSTLLVIFASSQLSLLYWVFWKSKLMEVFLFEFFYCTSISLLKIPVLTLKGILLRENVIQVNQAPRVLWEAIYIYLLLLLIYMLLQRHKIAELILRQLMAKNKILCALIITSEWLMLCYCMKIGRYKFKVADLMLNLAMILCAFMVILVIALSYVYQQLKSENLLQQETYDHLKSQYYGLKELYETNSRWAHDAKHEFLYIGSCLEENNVSGAYESLQSYLQKLRQIEKKVWSGFVFLDFLLNYKKIEMDKKNIDFVLDAGLQNITIPEEDLVIMLGNLLDNAIEATQKCEVIERYIKLKICNLNNMLLLHIENSSSEMPRLENGKFISSKQETGVHGLGIESVRRIVETYEGEIHFQYTEKYFQVKILI